MHAGDGGILDFVQVCERGFALLHAFRQQLRQRCMRQGEYVSIGGFFTAFVEANSGELAIFHFEAAYRSAQNHFPAAALNLRLAAVVEFGEGNSGNAHAVARSIRQNSFPKNIDAVARVDSLKLFAQGTDEDNPPETIDGALRLAAAAEPFEHGNAGRFLDISGLALAPQNVEHPAADGQLVPQREGAEGGERAHDMEWSRQEARLEPPGAALRAEEETLFKQTHAPAGFSQRDAGCQSRQPAADHDHAFQGYSLPCGGRSAPWR